MIDFWIIFEWFLLIVIGLPFIVVIMIPLLVYFGEKSKRIPSFTFLLRYFDIDIMQSPYSDWMEKSPILFIGMTSLEIYTSYYLIKLIRGIKWIIVGIKNLMMRYMHWQWARWDKQFEEEEKKRRTG